MKNFRRLCGACVFLFSLVGATQTLTRYNMVADGYYCKPRGDLSLIQKYEIEVPKSTPKEQQMVANALRRLEQVAGGASFPYFRKQNIRFVDELTSGNRGCKGGEQLPDGMVIARRVCRNAEAYNAWKRISNPGFVGIQAGMELNISETLVTHEIGHKVGNTDQNYKKYDEAVRPRCMLTNYSYTASAASRRGEEFAEAFAMFVVKPEFLKSNCPKAYEFFKTVVFKLKGEAAACQPLEPPKPKPATAASTTPAVKPAEKVPEKPADKPATSPTPVKPAEKPGVPAKPAEKTPDKPAAPAAKPVEKAPDKPVVPPPAPKPPEKSAAEKAPEKPTAPAKPAEAKKTP